MIGVDAEAADFGGVWLIATDADHADDLLVDFSDPEVMACFVEVGFLNIVDIGTGVVGRDLAGEQTAGVEACNGFLIVGLEGADDQAL